MLGPTSKSCWAKTKVSQDKDHVGVHIGQHQGHVGADIKVKLEGHVRADVKVMLGQDEGRSK